MLLAISGGSGIYNIDNLKINEEKEVWTPYGKPSSKIVMGNLDGNPVVFITRHGKGHYIPPHKVNYRANIWALKSLGVTHILAMSAVGSLVGEAVPGDFVLVDQFIDFTKRRDLTFYDDIAVHVSLADPCCSEFSSFAGKAAESAGITVHDGGTYICIEGPQFSTRAESHLFRSFGAKIIGMTTVTEARLAREAEIHFATLAMVTDFDCWHEEEEDVTVETVLETIRKNGESANKTLVELAKLLNENKMKCEKCNNSLKGAVMTSSEEIPPSKKDFYSMLLGSNL
jgi:5'-methylthioadenosine phosphorylase